MPLHRLLREQGRLLALVGAALLGGAGAHGESTSDLRGVTLCLDPASVQVKVEAAAPDRADLLGREMTAALTRSLSSALERAQVRHEVRPSCEGSGGMTRLTADVRYLSPRHYVGFGDPAYSYDVLLQVGGALSPPNGTAQGNTAPRGFSSGWADIHSEARTRRPFTPVVIGWGEEAMRDLVVVWQRDNPTLAGRLTRGGPLTWGLIGLGGGTLVALLAALTLRRRGTRGRPPLAR